MRHELILGGQRSGKSRCAEARACAWLVPGGREAVLLATARPGDQEMSARIAAHRRGRALRVPALVTVEVPQALAEAVRDHGMPQRMLVVDCLTLWLTQRLMPPDAAAARARDVEAEIDALCRTVAACPGPVVLVSNEIGLGVAPVSPEARRFVDLLGLLHQQMAAICGDVTLMVAGIEVPVRRHPEGVR